MGTNYYFHEVPACEHCKRPYPPRHIGKSSGGWTFALHIYPEERINNLEDWKQLFNTPGSYILDEYDRPVSVEEMLKCITERGWKGPGHRQVESNWYSSNHAIPGPNGLARCAIYPNHCIGHGEGTWDYIIGDFS